MNERDWLDILQALLTPAIAVVVAYIAWQQYQIQRQRVRIDLFDRRYELFVNANKYLTETVSKGEFDINLHNRFLKENRGAQFLYSKEIDKYLLDIAAATRELIKYESESRKNSSFDGDIFEAEKQKLEKLDWLQQQFDVMKIKFQPYLQVE